MAAKVTIDELSQIAAQSDEQAFVARFAVPALVLASPALDSEAKKVDTPTTGTPTEKAFGRTSAFDAGAYRLPPRAPLSETQEDDSPTPRKTFELLGRSEILFLKKTDRNPFEGMVTLGRAPNNDLVIAFATVSKVHATFTQEATGWTITDHRSTNGTLMDDERLFHGTPAYLADGSVIRFGPDVTAKFFTPAGLFRYLGLFRSGMLS